MNLLKLLAIALLCAPVSASAQIAVELAERAARPNRDDVITFYVLGDWGTGYIKQEPVAVALERNVARLAEIMKEHDIHLYFSGHEHNLQFIPLDQENAERLDLNASFFQIISGSAGKLSEITSKNKALFACDKQHGFARIDILNGDLWIEFLTCDAGTGNDKSLGLWKLSKGTQP